MEKRLVVIQLQKDLISKLYAQIEDLKEDNNCVKAENRILKDKIAKLEKLILSLDSNKSEKGITNETITSRAGMLFHNYA